MQNFLQLSGAWCICSTSTEITQVRLGGSTLNIVLQDILHTFKKGHKIIIQVQSTWFPYIDRNPQKYVENIFEANEEDFIKSTIRVYGNSVIEIGQDASVKLYREK